MQCDTSSMTSPASLHWFRAVLAINTANHNVYTSLPPTTTTGNAACLVGSDSVDALGNRSAASTVPQHQPFRSINSTSQCRLILSQEEETDFDLPPPRPQQTSIFRLQLSHADRCFLTTNSQISAPMVATGLRLQQQGNIVPTQNTSRCSHWLVTNFSA